MTPLAPGIHHGIPEADYLALDALGSTALSWLAVSPLYYRYMRSQPAEESPSLSLGTALHTAVLEPEIFARTFCIEPDPAKVAPTAASPRATKAYKEAVADMRQGGFNVLKKDTWTSVLLMRDAVLAHPTARSLLERATERQVTLVWEEDGVLCRARLDMAGNSILADLKTTRDLAAFSPRETTTYSYHRQLAHENEGLLRLADGAQNFFLLAVESSPPYDVAVFAMPPEIVACGEAHRMYLLNELGKCHATGNWPGMFPNVTQATISNYELERIANLEVA